jgi:potassium-transporting ATPase KdpC subunit
MQNFIAGARVAIFTMLVVVVGYTAVMLGIAGAVAPDNARGSLIAREDGTILGSRLIAQGFTHPAYFWPRPSAVGYNGAGAGGGNKSPTSTDLTDRAAETVAAYGATAENPLPAELAAASGGGLDPHITQRAALYQAPRVAEARGLPVADVAALIRAHSFLPGGFLTPDPLVNVLELNLALNDRSPAPVIQPATEEASE